MRRAAWIVAILAFLLAVPTMALCSGRENGDDGVFVISPIWLAIGTLSVLVVILFDRDGDSRKKEVGS